MMTATTFSVLIESKDVDKYITSKTAVARDVRAAYGQTPEKRSTR
jgi:hypothetical protein